MKELLVTLIALTGAEVHLPNGQLMNDATILVEGERIMAVGAEIPIPKSALQLDVSGKVITAGFIDPATTLGLVEISGVAPSNDIDSGGDPIRAAQRAADSYNAHSAVIPVQRVHGITTVHTSHQGGLISGQGAVYDLTDSYPVASPASVVARISGREEGARGQSVMTLREILDDARTYAANKRDYQQNRLRTLGASRLALESLSPLLSRSIPLFVHVNRRSDIRTMLRIADTYRIRMVILGGAEAWMEADALASAQVPVIMNPIQNQPSTFDAIHSRGDAATILTNAGVKVAFSTFSAHDVRKLRQWAGNAVRSGLTHSQALMSITQHPAEILGLTTHGKIQTGAIANLVVWSGDPFEVSSRVLHLFIRGKKVSLDHRQKRLFQRYRTLPVKR